MQTKSPLINFIGKFDTDNACYSILCDYKWKDGYKCRRCGCAKSVAGRTKFHKRCSSCLYDESCTAHTLFHKLKFPIVKAFAIIFQLSTLKKGMSSCEIARQHGIHQETAWFFQRKVQLAMSGSIECEELSSMEKIVDLIIQSFENKPNRISEKMIHEHSKTIHNQFRPSKKNSSKRSILNPQEKNSPVKKKQKLDLKMIISHKEKRAKRTFHFLNLACQDIHMVCSIFRHFNLKNWLLGVHHKVSLQHLKKYLGDFLFKLKNRRALNKIPLVMIKSFIKHDRVPYFSIVAP